MDSVCSNTKAFAVVLVVKKLEQKEQSKQHSFWCQIIMPK